MAHFVNTNEIDGDMVAYLVNLTKGGADYSFECVGNVKLMRQTLECCHKGWGASIRYPFDIYIWHFWHTNRQNIISS